MAWLGPGDLSSYSWDVGECRPEIELREVLEQLQGSLWEQPSEIKPDEHVRVTEGI